MAPDKALQKEQAAKRLYDMACSVFGKDSQEALLAGKVLCDLMVKTVEAQSAKG